ncbi:SGNH/GDSL hydrolase family protein [Rickettsiales bacterium]|nr:SGNH/GDSL hydrolase family protein [Rickettsiales bacterium]
MSLIEKLSRVLIRLIIFSLLILSFFLCYRILGLNFNFLNKENFAENYIFQLLIILSITLFVSILLIWNQKKKIFSSSYTLILIGSFTFPILIFEYYATYKRYAIFANSLAFDYDYDVRTKRQVAEDINQSDGKAHPAFRVFKENIGLTPLAYSPNTVIVSKNEYGKHHKFLTDRHGFNNLDEYWDEKIEYLFVGDSFTEGCCLPNNNHFINIFRKVGVNALNLGISGNGPIINLGIIKEYAAEIKPKKIIWVHYGGNDLSDGINYYKKIKKFDNYLLDDYSQNLFQKKKEIESLLSDFYFNKLLKKPDTEKKLRSINEIFFSKDRLFLKSIRNKVNLRFNKSKESDEIDFGRFEQIISKAKRFSDRINAELIFINLPHEKDIKTISKNDLKVRKIITSQQIKYYDLGEIFKENKDLKKLFAFRGGDTGGHLSFTGNKIVGEYLKTILLN